MRRRGRVVLTTRAQTIRASCFQALRIMHEIGTMKHGAGFVRGERDCPAIQARAMRVTLCFWLHQRSGVT